MIIEMRTYKTWMILTISLGGKRSLIRSTS